MAEPISSIQKVWLASETPVVTIPKTIYDLLELRKGDLVRVTYEKIEANNQRGEQTTAKPIKAEQENSPNKKEINVRRK